MKRLLIGKITGAHGIKGDVKILSYAEDAGLLFRNQGVFTSEDGDATLTLHKKSSSKVNHFIACIDNVSDRNGAEAIRGTQLFIDESDLPELDDDDGFYTHDLEGLNIETPDGKNLGHVASIQNYGAGDLVDVKPTRGDNYYIPLQEPYLIEIDMDGKRIIMLEPEAL